ncbi:uncharacterized protein LOC129302915 [Prosopis cineraria]|uniref:uncharacterized protein LOC129298996 n=1 Tax=Prosopis cineraria TaxID=364024 RepID=UPI00240FF8E8|nr:uncharacterized protein LOC129298996 [Prosopis cineraria]XP_054797800.1 uncharacterized protein LOC129302915 [Prosopis cineraria]
MRHRSSLVSTPFSSSLFLLWCVNHTTVARNLRFFFPISGPNNVKGGGLLMFKAVEKPCRFAGLKWSVFLLIVLTLSGLNHKVLEARHAKEGSEYTIRFQVRKRSFGGEKDGTSFANVEREVPSSPDPLHNRCSSLTCCRLIAEVLALAPNKPMKKEGGKGKMERWKREKMERHTELDSIGFEMNWISRNLSESRF